MPIFIGAIWNDNTSKINEYPLQKFSELIKKNTNQKTIEEKTSFWHICAALKNYETHQEKIIIYPKNAAMILGRIYPEENNVTVNSFEYDKKWSPKNYWGRYIAIVTDNEKKEISIYRDPLGLSHVYFMQFNGCLFFSSDIHLILNVISAKKSTVNCDWEYFASYLSLGLLNTAKTPFKEVTELLPGCALTFNKFGVKINNFWDPTAFSTASVMKKENINSIMPVFNKIVSDLIEKTPAVCLQLSGGLDSTALFLAINRHMKKSMNFIIVNYLNKKIGASDESVYVKELVKNTDVKILFHKWYFSFDPCKVQNWNRPHPGILMIDSKIDLMEKINLEKIELYNGHGGDNLFLTNVYSKYATDFLLQNRLKEFREFLNIVKNINFINRSPILPCLYSILKDLYRNFLNLNNVSHVPYRPDVENWYTIKLNELIKTQNYIPPFWNSLSASNIYPGKAQQILDVYHASALADFEYPGVTEIFPYLSQPLVELVLSIPTYYSFDKNWSRLHFRKAVADYFNTDRVWRRSKGETSGIKQISIAKNLKRVQELCLEGRMADNNFLDKNLLNQHIHLFANGQINFSIINLLAVELWFDTWSGTI